MNNHYPDTTYIYVEMSIIIIYIFKMTLVQISTTICIETTIDRNLHNPPLYFFLPIILFDQIKVDALHILHFNEQT